jgi:hypothetical protein
MPVMRDKDGNIIEQPTGRTDLDDGDTTFRVPAPGAASPLGSDTRRMGLEAYAPADDAKTMIYRGNVAGAARRIQAVAGWLVVIEGPGRGRIFEMGYGHNSVGRGPGNRIQLDIDDPMISSEDQCMVTYDPEDGQFYVAGGRGVNLTKHNGAVLSAANAPLFDKDQIRFGETTLLFVALCSKEFHW